MSYYNFINCFAHTPFGAFYLQFLYCSLKFPHDYKLRSTTIMIKNHQQLPNKISYDFCDKPLKIEQNNLCSPYIEMFCFESMPSLGKEQVASEGNCSTSYEPG